MPEVTRASLHPLQRLPRRLALLVALGITAACGPETAPRNGGTPGAAIVTAVTTVTPRGFTLTLQPGVPGILPEDLALTPAVAIARVTAVDMSNRRYAVATQAHFALGQEYTLTITKAGYSMTSPRFMRGAAGSEANILQMTLTVAGVEVRGRITDTEDETSIRFLGGAKATPVPLLTGTVALKLSLGAQVAGTSPAGTEKTYTSTGTRITIRAEDGTTTKTYSIRVADYDANTNPYGVYTIAQLHAVRNGRTDSYRLMQSLTLPGLGEDCEAPFPSQDDYCAKGFSPIGLEASPFTGTFDGNGQRIQNLAIRRSATDSVGLFGHMGASGEIRRLGVVLAEAGVTGGNAVGGLVGTSWGIVTKSYAKGAVSGSGNEVGGLMGHMRVGSVTDASAEGAVSGNSTVGGLVGKMSGGNIANASATGTVTGSGSSVGGLVGHMPSTGSITNASFTGATVTGNGRVGGLVGNMNDGTVANAYATAAVIGYGHNVGGLVGYAGASNTVSDCYATGYVSGSGAYVGGLVGLAAGGRIANSHASGEVSGGNRAVGGLVGYTAASNTVTNCYATGDVFGNGPYVGGLTGDSSGTVANAYATGDVSGSSSAVGGLLGWALGSISTSYAIGAVSGGSYVGGLVGFMKRGTVTNCYAVGVVTGSGASVGGLLGSMVTGTATNCYAAGAVFGGNDVGGLVGHTQTGSIANSYYPLGRPAGAGGSALSSWARRADFAGFAFSEDASHAWEWANGKWPQLKAIEATQTTPNLGYHSATVTASSTSGFTVALQPALRGLTETDNWALYNSSTNAAVNLYKAAATIESSMGGGSYAFAFETTPLAANTTYHLLYTRANVIVVPSPATGSITVTVP